MLHNGFKDDEARSQTTEVFVQASMTSSHAI